jgi:hypothetical protein
VNPGSHIFLLGLAAAKRLLLIQGFQAFAGEASLKVKILYFQLFPVQSNIKQDYGAASIDSRV